jgi:putative flippase GtrA
LNYWLCIVLLFRRGTKWSNSGEILAYGVLVTAIGAIDAFTTVALIKAGTPSIVAKTLASAIALIFNFLGRRLFIFPERPSSDWAASNVAESGRTAAALPHDSLRGSR